MHSSTVGRTGRADHLYDKQPICAALEDRTATLSFDARSGGGAAV